MGEAAEWIDPRLEPQGPLEFWPYIFHAIGGHRIPMTREVAIDYGLIHPAPSTDVPQEEKDGK